MVPRPPPSSHLIVPNSTGTSPTAINPSGVIAGNYSDSKGNHGFVRSRDGTITPIDPLGSTYTTVAGVTPEGKITGYYTDASGVDHGPAGEITGYYYDSGFVNHGFLSTPGGTFTPFDGSVATLKSKAAGFDNSRSPQATNRHTVT
jgi:hypothetical protein